MRILIPIMGLVLALGPTTVSRAADDKQKTKTKVEHDGDVKIKTKTHVDKHGPDYKSKSKTKIERDGDVKYKEKTNDGGKTIKRKEKIDR